MADKKISQLNPITSVGRTDVLAVVQNAGVETNKATVDTLGKAIALRERFNAGVSQSIFGLSFTYELGTNRLMVFKNGNLQEISEDYTELSTTSIQFTSPLDPPDKVTVFYM